MSLLNRDHNGSEITRDTPKKTGAALVFSTLYREAGSLISLNFMFLIFLLPFIAAFILTVSGYPLYYAALLLLVGLMLLPAALTAMSRITVTMVRDENFFLWRDFWKSFRLNFGKALLGGFLFGLGLSLLSLAAYVYYNLFGIGFLMAIIGAFTACLVIIVLGTSLYYWPMLSYVELPAKALLKNSLLLVFGAWRRTLLAFLVVAVSAFFIVGLYPNGFVLFVACLIGFSLTSLMLSFAVYPAIYDKVIRREEEKKKPDPLVQQLVWEEEPQLESASVENLDFGPEDE